MCLLDLIATLVGEPFNLGIDQIKRLSLFQVANVYLRQRDEKGALIPLPDPDAEETTVAQRVGRRSMMTNTPEWFIREKYGRKQ